MSGVTRYSTVEVLNWEPEPLYLPIDDHSPRPRPNHLHDERPDDQDERDRPGSHVIVIDLG